MVHAARRHATLLGIVLLVAGPVSAASDPDLSGLTGQIAEALKKAGKKSVAVGDALPITPPSALGAFFSEELALSLSRHTGVEVARERTPMSPRDLAKKLGVEAVVDPAYTTFDESIRLSVKVVDGGSGRIIEGFSLDLPRKKRLDELARISPPARGGDKPAPTPVAATRPAKPTQADGSPLGPRQTVVPPLTLTVQSCNAYRATVSCVGQVTNPTRERFALECSKGEVYFVDENGGQSGTNDFALGASGYSQWVEPGLSMRWTLKGVGISTNSTSGSMVMRCTVRNSTKARSGWTAATIRDIPLQRD